MIGDIPLDLNNVHVVAFITKDGMMSEVETAINIRVNERPVGLEELTSIENVNVYPNPTSSYFSIKLSNGFDPTKVRGIRIFSSNAKLIYE